MPEVKAPNTSVTIPIVPVSVPSKKNKSGYRAWRLPPDNNDTMHWAARSRINKQFAEQVYWQIKAKQLGKWPKASIVLENHTTQPADVDNLITSMKPLIDAVIRAGLLPDDKEKYVGVAARNIKVKHRNEERVALTIVRV